jgi:mannose-6-phosphate isomerase-like protein (cupin superfamily)
LDLKDLSKKLEERPPDEFHGSPIVLERPNNSESVVYDSQAWALRISGLAGSSDGIECSVSNGELFHVVFSLEDDIDLQYSGTAGGIAEQRFKYVLGAIIPLGTRYKLRARGGTVYQYVAKTSDKSEESLSIDSPVAFRKNYLIQVLGDRRPNPYKIVIPRQRKGEVPARGGEVMGARNGARPIVKGTKGHGFSVADTYSKQYLHFHHELSEIFVGQGKTTLVWRDGTKLLEREVSAGNAICIPPLTVHGVELTGDLYFVVQGSRAEYYTVETDKEAILKVK